MFVYLSHPRTWSLISSKTALNFVILYVRHDWSKEDIGYLLLQKHCQCTQKSPVCCKDGWKLIVAGSQFTNNTESNYSPTEGEALALFWGLKHSRIFTLGYPNLLVATNHKPLLSIFNDRDLGSILNPRVQNLKEGNLPWHFSISHCLERSRCPVTIPWTSLNSSSNYLWTSFRQITICP